MTNEQVAPNRTEQVAGRSVRRTELGAAVAARARRLQALSQKDVPSVVRTLAVLRRANPFPPGASPDAWADTIDLVPHGELGRGDDPSAAEHAVHQAITLFAIHRQGRVTEAHVDGVAPGAAFGRLATLRGIDSESEGVRRRLDALVTASSPAEAARHLRGLVLLLRSENVPLDYGLLAEDLVDLWTPYRRDSARLRWARRYRSRTSRSDSSTPRLSTTAKE